MSRNILRMPEKNRITQYFGYYYCKQRQLTEHLVVNQESCTINDSNGISEKNTGISNYLRKKFRIIGKMTENPIIPVQSCAPGFFVRFSAGNQ